MKICVVVPTVRPDVLPVFLDAWLHVEGLDNAYWIIVEDKPKKSDLQVHVPLLSHVSWENIDKEPDNWIISRQTSAVRSYGFLLAWRAKADIIITLDDDCMPEDNRFLWQHLGHLNRKVPISWTTSWEEIPVLPRGFPYGIRDEAEVMLNHGVWSKIPDLDAKTQKAASVMLAPKAKVSKIIPRGSYFPLCGMNLAFKRTILPAMYFGLQGPKWGYDRFDDIWCGVILKKICDHLYYGITSGMPSLIHTRMSNVEVNLKKEAPGLELNETFWQLVQDVDLKGCHTVTECFRKIACGFPTSGYLGDLQRAMLTWAGKFEDK